MTALICADTSATPALWPLAVYAGAVVALVAFLLAASWVLGERHRERTTGEAYESGIAPTGPAQGKFPAGYYVVAILFVIFDLEVVLFVTWAVTARQAGWRGFAVIAAAAVTLTAAWAYLWRIGALEWWRPRGIQRRSTRARQEDAAPSPPLHATAIPLPAPAMAPPTAGEGMAPETPPTGEGDG